MKLQINTELEKRFGDNAKWIDLSGLGVQGLIFRSNSLKMSRYDEIHLGKFVSSGTYVSLLKEFFKLYTTTKKILFEVEYGILKINMMSKKTTKTITIGLFYGRSLSELIEKTKLAIQEELILDINVRTKTVQDFFSIFKKSELQSREDLDGALEVFEKISCSKPLSNEIMQIKKYAGISFKEA